MLDEQGKIMQYFELLLTGNLKTQKRSKMGKSKHHLNWKKNYFLLPEAASKYDIPWVTFRNSTLVKSFLLYSCGSKSFISRAGTAKMVFSYKFFLTERVNLSLPFQLLLKTFCISHQNTREWTTEKANKEVRKVMHSRGRKKMWAEEKKKRKRKPDNWSYRNRR